jgi:hypothetical protein
MTAVIDLSYWPTPNGHKITMALEAAGEALLVGQTAASSTRA